MATESQAIFIGVTSNEAGQRIDNFLFKRFKKVPKSLFYRLLRKGAIRVNGRRVKQDYKLDFNDEIRVPPLTQQENKAVMPPAHFIQQIENSILFEDDLLVVLNKPSGVAVHAGSGIHYGVIEGLRQRKNPAASYLELVHRIDRETSGLLLLAKSRKILLQLHDLLQKKQIDKSYRAVVHGQWPSSETAVTAPLSKGGISGGEHRIQVDESGKAACTEFRCLQAIDHYSLVEAKPITGRTHQIRVHAAHCGHPLIGDRKYGNKKLDKGLGFSVKRLFLHSFSVKFKLPDEEVARRYQAPLPTCFSDLF